jgi:dephospho-CoA kinase
MGLTILGVSGAIGAGKSSLAAEVASQANAERVSFGDFVRETAAERGIPDDRETLQDLGANLLDEWGADEFTARVVGDRTGIVIVDGVRHVVVDDSLRKLADHYLLVFVDVDDDVRRQRLDERDEDAANIEQVDSHSTEQDLPQLRARADVVVDSTGSGRVVALIPR